jgi:hypothetical protein
MIYQLYTFVDITETKIYHGTNDIKKYQQQNFDTLVQTIGLCGNVYFDHSPIISEYTYKKCWYFEWQMEIPDLFKRDDNPVALLPELFQFVPFIPNLTEEIKFDIPIFKPNENIFFDYKKPYGLKRNI